MCGPDFRDGSGISAVLIEHCFMNNSHDVQFLDSEQDLKNLAKADADAIIEYYGLKLKSDVVSFIKIDKESINLIEGKTTKVNVTEITPVTAKNKNVTWKSNDEKIAKVDENGNVTAISTGKTTISVTSVNNPNVSKNIEVNVEKEEVKFEKQKDNILFGKEKTLNVKISPSWITQKNISWESSNNEIATVDNNGKIKAKQEGKATIKVTWKDKNLSDEIEVNVIKLSEDTKIEIKNYAVNDEKISKIGQKVKIVDFLKNINISDNLKVTVKTANEGQEYIGTNTKVIVSEKEHDLELEEYNCLIYGDINGDGKISSLDYTLIKNDIMDVKKITDNTMKLTADVNGDGKISSLDYTLIKNDIMDVKKITIK